MMDDGWLTVASNFFLIFGELDFQFPHTNSKKDTFSPQLYFLLSSNIMFHPNDKVT
jgi:hypothetical protein